MGCVKITLETVLKCNSSINRIIFYHVQTSLTGTLYVYDTFISLLLTHLNSYDKKWSAKSLKGFRYYIGRIPSRSTLDPVTQLLYILMSAAAIPASPSFQWHLHRLVDVFFRRLSISASNLISYLESKFVSVHSVNYEPTKSVDFVSRWL